jgi:glycine betaine/proline transport system permease protein
VSTVAAPSQRRVTKEEQPYVAPVRKRYTGAKLGGVLVAWLVGWAILQGRYTLALPFQELTGFHIWLNGIRDSIQQAATTNWFFHGVIGTFADFVNAVVDLLQRLVSKPSAPRPVPEIGWLGVVAILGWVAYAVASWRAAVLVVVSVLLFGVLGYWDAGGCPR